MPHSNQRFVLAVDDEDIVLMAFEKAFAGQTEFLLDTAKTTREALERLAQVQYSLVFMDMSIDGHSWAGLQLIREIKRLEIRAKSRGQSMIETLVVIMSGKVRFDNFLADANQLGVLVFMDKKVEFTAEYIRDCLHRLGLPLLPNVSNEDK